MLTAKLIKLNYFKGVFIVCQNNRQKKHFSPMWKVTWLQKRDTSPGRAGKRSTGGWVTDRHELHGAV